MKKRSLRTLSIWGLMLICSLFVLGLTGIAAESPAGAIAAALWIPVIGMAVGRAAGYPDLGPDGLNKLIPILWAAEAREKFYDATCLNEISNTNATGANEIKNMGDKVIINTIPDVPIHDYQKGQLLDVDYLESPSVEMTVDYAKQFNFAVDEIDLKQVKIKDWISKYSDNATKRMKITIETHIFGSIYADFDATNVGATAGKISADLNLGVTGTPITLTKANVLDYILYCGQCLDENSVPEDQRWMVIPAWMATLLKGSDLKNASMTGDGKSVLRNGRIGDIDRFTLYSSNLLAKDTATKNFHIPYGHKEAIWFVSQYTKVKMYEPERSFAQAMKGLNVYGFGVLQPTLIGEMVAKKG